MMVEAQKDMATKNKHIKAVIQLRRATEQEWYEINPILRVGEPALSTDVYKIKVGNGIHHWEDLPYIMSDGSEIPYISGNGIKIRNHIISLDNELILDCGTSTTVI